MPAVLVELLNSHDATRGTVIRNGIAEHETALPPGTHGPRGHDLALFAEHGESIVTICVEAKADEPFGATVTDELRNAKKRPVTTFPQRLDWLTRTLFGLAAFNGEDHDTVSDQVRNLPYQLLTVTAGTLREAELRHSTKGNSRDSRISDAKDRRREDGAKCQPIESLSSASASAKRWADENFQLRCGQLIGPLPLPVEEVHQISLFVGNLEPAGWGDKDEIAPRKTAQYGL